MKVPVTHLSRVLSACLSSPQAKVCTVAAGLLTPGSFADDAFPGYPSGIHVVVVPGYSGGSVPDLHGVPFSIPKELQLFFRLCDLYMSIPQRMSNFLISTFSLKKCRFCGLEACHLRIASGRFRKSTRQNESCLGAKKMTCRRLLFAF